MPDIYFFFLYHFALTFRLIPLNCPGEERLEKGGLRELEQNEKCLDVKLM